MLIAQSTQDMIGSIGGVTQLGAGIGMLAAGASMALGGGSGGGAMQAGFGSAISGAQTLAQSIMPSLVSEGMQSSIGVFGMPCLDVIITKFPPDDDPERFGRPCHKKVKLSTLTPPEHSSTFIQCQNPWFKVSGCRIPERHEIESWLARGIILEQYHPAPTP